MTQNNKPRLIDTVKEWGSIILSGLGIIFLLTLLKKDSNGDTTQLENDIKDVEDNIKKIEQEVTTIEDIVDRWNSRGR